MTTTTNVKQTKLNIMTQAQYNSATKSATELYMVTDAQISYNDLTDKPTIPTVNNATLTITQGGVSKGTFTANASSDVTIALDAGGGGASALTDLTDVTISSATSGQVLGYNGTNWVNTNKTLVTFRRWS